jgi:hypothetical protein
MPIQAKISRRITMMDIGELRIALLSAKARNPDAFLIIGAVVGMSEKRVTEIAKGKGAAPTTQEVTILAVHAKGGA